MHLKFKTAIPETVYQCGDEIYLCLPKPTKVYYKATTVVTLDVIIEAYEIEYDCDFTGVYFEDSFPVNLLAIPDNQLYKYAVRLVNPIVVYNGVQIEIALDYLDIRTEQQLPLYTEPETGFQYSVLPKGMRLVQIICPVFRQIDRTFIVTAHDTTERGAGSFGSTDYRIDQGI